MWDGQHFNCGVWIEIDAVERGTTLLGGLVVANHVLWERWEKLDERVCCPGTTRDGIRRRGLVRV